MITVMQSDKQGEMLRTMKTLKGDGETNKDDEEKDDTSPYLKGSLMSGDARVLKYI